VRRDRAEVDVEAAVARRQPTPEETAAVGRELNHVRRGAGEPVLLLHGFGSYLHSWDPVFDRLARERDAVAIDLPGFGKSPPFPLDSQPDIGDYVAALLAFMDRLGLERPHVAGNSVGGWLALELAKRGRVRSVTAVDPTGLWPRGAPPYVMVTTLVSLMLSRVLRRVYVPVARSMVLRTLLMNQVFGRPWAVPPEDAVATVANVLESPGVLQAIEASRTHRFRDGRRIDVPVTIVFGTRDRSILPSHRHNDQLPPTSRWVYLRGCGHVPMWDDPIAVAQVVLAGSADGASAASPAIEERSPAVRFARALDARLSRHG
jgi:pimeloyl-ACP methyl ester carboxylesterase